MPAWRLYLLSEPGTKYKVQAYRLDGRHYISDNERAWCVYLVRTYVKRHAVRREL